MMSTWVIGVATLLAPCSAYTTGRVPALLVAARTGHPLAAATDFEADNWKALATQLDRLPVFTVANAEGQPLQYEIDGTPTALFYADVDAAKAELTNAVKEFPELNCDLIPVGVGSAYKLTCEGKAILLPSVADLTAAGAPAGVSAMGQPLPLFACMEMSQEINGSPVLPLFMAWSDCAAAVSQATSLDSPDEKLEIVGLSLPSVVERLMGVESESTAFTFIPPSASAKHINEYLENSGGVDVKTSS